MSLIKKIKKKGISILTDKEAELRFPEDFGKVSSNSLLHYYGNVHSQRGQDGILAEIFRRMNISKGTFVEFGA